MATHKGHFSWLNEEVVYGKQQWTRVYFVLNGAERALYIFKQKKDQSKEWKKIDVSKGSCVNGRQKGKKHVFVFTANDKKTYIFRSEHKNKKKQWIRYLNEAATVKEEKPVKKDEDDGSSSSEAESSSSDDGSSSSDDETEDEAAKKKAEEEAAAKKKAEEEAVQKREAEDDSSDSSSSDDDSSSSEEESSEDEAAKKKAEEEAAAKKKAEEEAEAARKTAEEEAAAAKKKAEEEAEAARKKAEEEAAAAKKKAEEEEESSSSDSDSSSSDDSSSDSEEEEKKEEEAAPEVGKNVTVENSFPRLLQIQGKKKTEITVTHVPLAAANVNDSDVFVLDNNKTVYTWLGSSPNMWQKQFAAGLTRAMDDERGSSVTNLVISQATSSDAAAFWNLLGGKPETLSKTAPEASVPVLFQLSDASGKMEFKEVGRGNPLKRSLLDSNDVFIADLGFHIFVWIGKKASREERDLAVGHAVVYKKKYKRPDYIHVERVMDGGENELLYSFFTQ